MPHYSMIIDMNRCVGCGACVIACQEEWDLPIGAARCWVVPMKPEASSLALSYTHYVGQCNHCQQATCLDACPTAASYRDEQGRIRVEPQLCIGCGYCVDACPYGARMVRADQGTVVKCDFCAPRVDIGLVPACVQTCPAGARIFGDLDDGESPVSRYRLDHSCQRHETPAVSIKPQVFYVGRQPIIDRIFSENPPNPKKTGPPIQGVLLEKLLRPGFFVLLGVTALGQGMDFFWQRTKGRAASAAKKDEKPASDPMLRRRAMSAVCLHWFNALVWILASLSGFGLLRSSRYRVMPEFFHDALPAVFGSRAALLQFHIALGLCWLFALLLYGAWGPKRHLLTFLRELSLRAHDIDWLRARVRGIFVDSEQDLPPQGKYNAGQKLFGIVVTGGSLLIMASGLIMFLLPGSGVLLRWSIPVHFLAASLIFVALGVHVYMTLLVRSERPALWSMVHGRIPESYAREHNRLWWVKIGDKRMVDK